MSIFKEAADIRTADTLDLEKPDAVVKEIVAKPSKIQKRAINLSEREQLLFAAEVLIPVMIICSKSLLTVER